MVSGVVFLPGSLTPIYEDASILSRTSTHVLPVHVATSIAIPPVASDENSSPCGISLNTDNGNTDARSVQSVFDNDTNDSVSIHLAQTSDPMATQRSPDLPRLWRTFLFS
jgi:hypothetical protein